MPPNTLPTTRVVSVRLEIGVYESLRHLLPTLQRDTGLQSLNSIMSRAIRSLIEPHHDALPPQLRLNLRFDSFPRASRMKSL